MAALGTFTYPRLIFSRHVTRPLYITKRFRVKKKWASTRKTKTASVLAIEHFDTYYPAFYEKQWPSLRVALLSQSKYCALANNFSQIEDITSHFDTAVFEDIVETARNTLPSEKGNRNLSYLANSSTKQDVMVGGERNRMEMSTSGYYVSGSGEQSNDYDPTDIYQYMPVKKVISEEDKLLEEEHQQSLYEPGDIEVPIIEEPPVKIPQRLKAYCYERGDVRLFPTPPKDDGNILGYYLMDAASLLPVLALDLSPGDEVLDLCAAPGGKTLAMIQTLLPESITCVDHSYSRMGRLMDVLRWYTPSSYRSGEKIKTVHANAVKYCQLEQRKFDKILVDVPCYTDRHVVAIDENNIFRRSRMKDRLKIQTLQHEILLGAMTLLKPGGTLVYSTCTLSMPQNDGTVQSVMEKLWQLTNIDISVVNTAPLVDRFRNIFRFHNKCRLGQLVLPNLAANFGPTYFCKMKRSL